MDLVATPLLKVPDVFDIGDYEDFPVIVKAGLGCVAGFFKADDLVEVSRSS